MHLTKQLSRSKCVEGRTFGCDGESMWTQGCRGEFQCNGAPVTCSVDGPGKHQCACKGSDISGATLFTYDVTIPAGSVAEVHLPKMGAGPGATVREGGQPVWSGGKFVGNTIAGLRGAVGLSHEVVVAAGSGSFSFAVHAAPGNALLLKTDEQVVEHQLGLSLPRRLGLRAQWAMHRNRRMRVC